MKTTARSFLLLCCLFLISHYAFAQPANNAPASAQLITSSTTCSNTAGTVFAATNEINASTCTGATVRYDVWYKFVATSSSPTVTLSGVGAGFPNPRVEVLSGITVGTTLNCGTSPLTMSGLNVGTTYYIRVYTLTTSTPTAANGVFNICVQDP